LLHNGYILTFDCLKSVLFSRTKKWQVVAPWWFDAVAVCSQRARITRERSQNDGTARDVRDASTTAQGELWTLQLNKHMLQTIGLVMGAHGHGQGGGSCSPLEKLKGVIA